MSMGARGKTTNSPREVAAVQMQSERESMFGEMPGRIVSFDPSNQTVTVQPLYRPVHNGEPVDMPELLEVPVRFPRMGGFAITTPVKAGDIVTLRPQMRSGEEYHTGGAFESPQDKRSMSLSDMEAFLDGGEPITDALPAFNSENFEIRSADGSFKFEMSEDGRFNITGSQGNVYELLTEVVELLTTEPLQHTAQYGVIAAKLRAMVL